MHLGRRKKSLMKRCGTYFNMLNPHYWIFLIILGFITAMIGFAIDELVDLVGKSKYRV
jgi:hypothetical protein